MIRINALMGALLGASLLATSGCDVEPLEEPAAEPVSQLEQGLYVYPGVRLFTENNNYLPVCWMNTGWAREKGIIRSAVENSWVREANLRISWTDCANIGSQPYIRVQIDPGNGDGQAGNYGMANLSTGGRSVIFWLRADGTTDETRLRYLAVHEFGHVLGFAHEQDQPGLGSEQCRRGLCESATGMTSGTDFDNCMRGAAGNEGGVANGPFDRQSVMSYCGPNNGDLTPLDVEAARRIFGRKHDGAIVGWGGKCLNVWEANFASGQVRLFDCYGVSNDTWRAIGLGAAEKFLFGINGSSCLNAGGFNRGDALRSSGSCSVNQAWQAFSFAHHTQIRGYGGMCLERRRGVGLPLPGGPTAFAVMSRCSPFNSAQNWQLSANREIVAIDDVFGGTRTCLDVLSNNTVALKPCNGQSSQQWSVWQGGYIASLKTGAIKVLDVAGFGTADGTPLQVWDYLGGPNQRFNFRAAIAGLNGRVIDINHGVTDNGAWVDLWDLVEGAQNEVFDFYP